MLNLNIKLIQGGATPTVKTTGAACYDAYARESKVIPAGAIAVVPLGFAIELPSDYEMVLRPRSGLAVKEGIICVPGTIDSDYRGEVGAMLYNTTDKAYTVNIADRVCQLAVRSIGQAKVIGFNPVLELSSTERGEGGFGHTGK